MANEVIVAEYGAPAVQRNGLINNTLGPLITSQVLNTAVKSAAFNADTKVINVAVKSTAAAAVWAKIGDTNVSAAANTAANVYIPIGGNITLTVSGGQFIDTAADA